MPVLHLPNSKGRFHLYSGTGKFTTSRSLFQFQNGKPGYIAYASKGMPGTAKYYSRT